MATQQEKLSAIQAEVLTALGSTLISFGGNHALAAARDCGVVQTERHNNYFGLIVRLAEQITEYARIEAEVKDLQQRYLSQVLPEFNLVINESDGGASITSNHQVPILTAESLDVLTASLPLGELIPDTLKVDIIGTMIAGYFYATRYISTDYNFYGNSDLDKAVQRGLIRIEHSVSIENTIRAKTSEVQQLIATATSVSATLQAALTERSVLNESAVGLQVKLVDLGSRCSKLDEDLKDAATNVQVLVNQIHEKLKLGEAKKLWSHITLNSAIAFYGSAAVLIVLLIGVPIAAIWHSNAILQFMLNIERAMMASAVGNSEVASTISAIGKLVLLSAPLGFVVWMIRILVRFNTRSLLLMDDARQRITMLNTYLFLIEQDAAAKQDRGAILEALFRRPPGHGGDTVEPPHFTELLKYGQDNPVKQ